MSPEQPPLVDWTHVEHPDSERALQRVFVHPDHGRAALTALVTKLPDARGWHVIVAEYPVSGFALGNSNLPTAQVAMQWAEVTVAVMWDYREEWHRDVRGSDHHAAAAEVVRGKVRAAVEALWREAYNPSNTKGGDSDG